MNRYACIVADPPWRVTRLESPGSRGFGTHERPLGSVPLPYPTLSVWEICALPVESFAATGAHLYLWTINRYIEAAYMVARAWGFKPSALLTWAKKPMGIGLGGAYSQTTEHVVFARRGSLPCLTREDSTWWQWTRGAHSAKPEAFIDMVERVSPAPRLEMFARRQRLGWDTWGNEALNHVELSGQAKNR